MVTRIRRIAFMVFVAANSGLAQVMPLTEQDSLLTRLFQELFRYERVWQAERIWGKGVGYTIGECMQGVPQTILLPKEILPTPGGPISIFKCLSWFMTVGQKRDLRSHPNHRAVALDTAGHVYVFDKFVFYPLTRMISDLFYEIKEPAQALQLARILTQSSTILQRGYVIVDSTNYPGLRKMDRRIALPRMTRRGKVFEVRMIVVRLYEGAVDEIWEDVVRIGPSEVLSWKVQNL
jgi:hypothetical protein